jgi:hypothetical protein
MHGTHSTPYLLELKRNTYEDGKKEHHKAHPLTNSGSDCVVFRDDLLSAVDAAWLFEVLYSLYTLLEI